MDQGASFNCAVRYSYRSPVFAAMYLCYFVTMFVIVNPFRGKPTYMSPKVKGYTDIFLCHPNLYGYRDTCVVWVIYTRNPLFRARVKISFTSKRVNYLCQGVIVLFVCLSVIL